MKPDKRLLATVLPLTYIGLAVFILHTSIAAVLLSGLAMLVAQLWLIFSISKEMKSFKGKLGLVLPYVLIMLAAVGVVASINLTVEEINTLKDPDYSATCTLNPIISCTSSIASDQGQVLGPPNPVLGIGAFAALMAIAFGLVAGARYAKWLWQAMWLASFGGMFVVGWFVYQALYELQALCIYCMTTWAAVIPLFVYLTLYVTSQKYIPLPKAMGRFIEKNHLAVVVGLYAVIVVLAYFQFDYYWNSLI